jgi:NADH-quinone oxidoreductase subunit G
MGNRVLGILNRGYKAYISPFNGDFIESGCEHCGSCIDVCPVGSLLDRAFKYKDRPWRMTKTWTTCSFCGSGCRVEIDTYHGRIKRAVGRIGVNEGHNRGYLCVRGKWGWDVVYSDKRLKEPLLKENGEFKKVSLEEAIRVLKEKVIGRRVNLFVESSLTNEELRRLRSLFGKEAYSDSLGYYNLLRGIASITGGAESAPLTSIYDADVIFVVGDFIEELTPVVATLLRLAVIQKGKRLIRLGTFPSKLDSVSFSTLTVPQEEVINTLKHLILGTFDTSYSSGNRDVDSVAKVLRGKRVAFVLGGLTPYSVEAEEIGKTVAYLADRAGNCSVVAVPPKANSLGVVKNFEIKEPDEFDGEVNVIVNAEFERDFFGLELPKAEFTVLFTPYYTPEVPLADLVIPIETALEKRGSFTGIEGELPLETALEPSFTLLGSLSSLPVIEEEGGTRAEFEVKKEPGVPRIERKRGELLLTVLPGRTGWNSVSYYSENVAKVAGERALYLNPADYRGELVCLKTENGEITVKAVKDEKIPQGHALLRVERFTRDISELLRGSFPSLSGIKCEIAEE